MTAAEIEELCSRHPHLYHMAMRDSWASIQAHGLLPTSALVDLFEVPEERRPALLTRRRPSTVVITHPELGKAAIRDQIPLSDADLEFCLQDGLSVADWHAILNGRVFFWLTRERLHGLMCAKAYRDMEHLVLKLCTADLVRAHADRIELSPMNSGCTRPWRHPRGAKTFQPFGTYPYADRKARNLERVVELTVIGGIPAVLGLVEEAWMGRCDGTTTPVFKA